MTEHATRTVTDLTTASARKGLRVALVPSCAHFEGFFGGVQGLTAKEYVEKYRSDFIGDYWSALAERGIETTVYMPALKQEGLMVADDGFRVRFLRYGRFARAMMACSKCFRGQVGRYALEYTTSTQLLPTIRTAIDNDRIDLLYVQEYWTPRFDALSRLGGIPLVAADHGGRSHANLTRYKHATLPRATAITCLTQQSADEVATYGGKSVFLPNGVDVECFRPKEGQATNSTARTILCVARLTDRQKRISDLLKALAELPSCYILKVVGTGPDQDALAALAGDLGVSSRVEFAGFQSRERVLSLLQTADVFALVSAHEGLPLAALEAMSCGLSTVVSDIPAFAELAPCDRVATTVPCGDPRAIASGIEWAYSQRKSIGPAAREHVVEHFSRAQVFDRLATLLHQCVAGQSASQDSASRPLPSGS